MASAARQRLMNEYKALDKEKWLKIEVSLQIDLFCHAYV
jgi:hypothetical protein